MERDRLAIFSNYLQSLPEELLESVTADYVWLAGLTLDRGESPTDFLERRECCREECARRGVPHLYELAEELVSPTAEGLLSRGWKEKV
jgi:hypothetical protein